jgi:hypothetical protein
MAASGHALPLVVPPALPPALPPIPAVLVLCQRSRSSTDPTVVETVKGLLNFIEDGLGVDRDFRIRFCTPCNIEKHESNPKKRKLVHGDYADYDLELDMSTLGEIKHLMNSERPPITSFKYVILHTCPFSFMDFEAISAIMKPGDIMIMTRSRDGVNDIVEVTQRVLYKSLAEHSELYSRIHKYFDDVTDKPGVYTKRAEIVLRDDRSKRRIATIGGGKKKGRKNTLRYKPKKYRRYHRTKRSGSKKLK